VLRNKESKEINGVFGDEEDYGLFVSEDTEL
jgi:hypothetical protein